MIVLDTAPQISSVQAIPALKPCGIQESYVQIETEILCKDGKYCLRTGKFPLKECISIVSTCHIRYFNRIDNNLNGSLNQQGPCLNDYSDNPGHIMNTRFFQK